jgi:outer membrane protein TolC
MIPLTRITIPVKIRQVILCLLVAALPTAAGAQTYTPMPEECFPQLGEILTGINASAPKIRMEAQSVEESEAYLKAARSARGLRVAGYGRIQGMYETRINSETTTNDDFNIGPYAGLNAGVPLFHWGELDARVAQAKAHIRATKSGEKQLVAQVRQDIRRSYIEYQLASMAAKIARENIEYARKRHVAMSGLVERGISSGQNVADADIYEQERQEDLAQAENQAASSEGMVKELTGRESLKLAETDFPKVPMLPADDLNHLGKAAGTAYLPQLEQLDSELAAEEASYKEISSRNRPKIDAVVSTNLDYTDEYRQNGRYESVPRLYSWAGVQASWTIYDSGSVDAEQLASLARQRRIKARIDEAKLRQTREVAEIARDAELNENRYQTRLRKLELLKKTVKMMESQMEMNSVSTNDLFQRKQELEATRLDLYRACAYYMLDIAQLRELASFGNNK